MPDSLKHVTFRNVLTDILKTHFSDEEYASKLSSFYFAINELQTFEISFQEPEFEQQSTNQYSGRTVVGVKLNDGFSHLKPNISPETEDKAYVPYFKRNLSVTLDDGNTIAVDSETYQNDEALSHIGVLTQNIHGEAKKPSLSTPHIESYADNVRHGVEQDDSATFAKKIHQIKKIQAFHHLEEWTKTGADADVTLFLIGGSGTSPEEQQYPTFAKEYAAAGQKVNILNIDPSWKTSIQEGHSFVSTYFSALTSKIIDDYIDKKSHNPQSKIIIADFCGPGNDRFDCLSPHNKDKANVLLLRGYYNTYPVIAFGNTLNQQQIDKDTQIWRDTIYDNHLMIDEAFSRHYVNEKESHLENTSQLFYRLNEVRMGDIERLLAGEVKIRDSLFASPTDSSTGPSIQTFTGPSTGPSTAPSTEPSTAPSLAPFTAPSSSKPSMAYAAAVLMEEERPISTIPTMSPTSVENDREENRKPSATPSSIKSLKNEKVTDKVSQR